MTTTVSAAEHRFEHAVTAIIVANSMVMLASLVVGGQVHELLEQVDVVCLWFFAAELAVRVALARLGFFHNLWNTVDLVVVVVALLPIAGGGIAFFVAGPHAGQGGFGAGHPQQAFGGEEREGSGVVEHFRQSGLRKIVRGDGAFGKHGHRRVLDAAAIVRLGAKQENRGRGALLEAGKKLGRGHQKPSKMALTTLAATALLTRSMAVPLSSKYWLGSSATS